MFGERLKKIRVERGLTQKQIFTVTHLSERNYQGIERGEYKPSYDTLVKLCKCLQVSSDYLLGFSDNEMVSNNHAGRKPKQSKLAKYLSDVYESLDEKGQLKLLSCAFDLANNKTN